jgi:hypothetical protein
MYRGIQMAISSLSNLLKNGVDVDGEVDVVVYHRARHHQPVAFS